MSFNFSPIGNGAQYFTPAGLPLSGGLLNTYLAGSTTPALTWTTNTGSVANSNPIQLGPDGRPPSEIWLASSAAYKFALTDSLGNLIATYDNIVGIVNAPTNLWVNPSPGVTSVFFSATQFTLLGNFTTTFVAGLRVQYFLTATAFYGSVVSSTFGGGLTTVTVLVDSTPLTSALTTVNISQITPNNSPTQTTFLQTVNNSVGVTLGNSNQSGNTILDWYEENPLTPVMTCAVGGPPTLTISGSFTRTGRIIAFDIQFSVTSWNGGSGNITISGMPYLAGIDGVIGGYYGEGTSANINFFAKVGAALQLLTLYRLTGANLLVSDVPAIWAGNLSGTYRA